MRIILVHNHYGSSAPSGENAVFLAESELLRRVGHDVITFVRHSDEIISQGAWGKIRGALSTPWNPGMASSLRRLVLTEKPDLVHIHNTFPLLSPSIFRALRSLPVATVFTLHNYRTVCAAAIPLRAGRVCTECLDLRSVRPALRHGCYRNSRLATLPLALNIYLQRKMKIWERDVDVFIALTEFQRTELIRAGLPAGSIELKPHFYPDPPLPLAWPERDDKVLYVGRLGAEKGVRFLIEAWRQWGRHAPLLELIGDGPLRAELQEQALELGDRVRFLGQLPYADVQKRLAAAKLLVLPSVSFEGFPMVIREAFALGVPVAASNLGSMAELVDAGRVGTLFAPAETDDLLLKVRNLWNDKKMLQGMGEAARQEFMLKYTAEANLRCLEKIYRLALERRRTKLHEDL